MKSKFLLFALFFLPMTAMGQVIFSENFNGVNPLNGWFTYVEAGSGSGWSINTPGGDSYENTNGTPAAYHIGNITGSGAQISWLVTPAIPIPLTGNFALTFWSHNANNPGNNSGVYVSKTGNNPSNYEFLPLKIITADDVSMLGKLITVFLPEEYAGGNIYIGFRYQGPGEGGESWYIDDVSVVECTKTVPWTEDFNSGVFPPVGWTRYKPQGDIQGWTAHEPSGSYENSNKTLAAYQDGDGGTGVQISWLVTPPISIPSTGNHALTFWSHNADNGDSYKSGVYVSKTGNNPLTPGFVWLKDIKDDDASTLGKYITVLLPDEYAGETIYLGFRYHGPGNGASWYIDDVSIIECTETVPWTEDFESGIFPPVGWTRYKELGDGQGWKKYDKDDEVTSSGSYRGTASAYHYHNNPQGPQVGWMVTPPISVPADNYVLKFWSFHAYTAEDNECTSGVWISTGSNDPTSASSTFILLKELTGDEMKPEWSEFKIPLGIYSGEDVFIAFKYTTEGIDNEGNSWYIDDIGVVAQVEAKDPNITTQPEDKPSVVRNSTVTLTVVANSPDAAAPLNGVLTYQWYSTDDPLDTSDGTLISGKEESSYTVPTNVEGTYYYYVVVTNTINNNGDGGQKTATKTSRVATVTVNSPVNAQIPSIVAQPEDITTGIDYPATLSVSAVSLDGGELEYQWYSNTAKNTSTGSPIEDATEESYSPSTEEVRTMYYYVVVTNRLTDNGDGGTKTATTTSDLATVTVNNAEYAHPPKIDKQPQGETVSINTPVNLTVEASTSKGTLTYQWYSNTENNTSGSLIGGATGASYTPSTATVGTTYYYVVVTNTINDNGDGGTKTATTTSNTAAVIVNAFVNAANPEITVQPQPATYEQNATADELTVTASSPDGGDLSYQWYSNTENNTSGSLINEATEESYTPSTATVGTTYYYVVVTNTIDDNGDGGAKTASVTSSTAAVTVEAEVNAETPVITASPQSAIYVQNATADALTVTATSPDDGELSYQWFRNAANNTTSGTKINDATEDSYTPSTATVGTTYYYVVVTNTIGDNDDQKSATATSSIAAITVNPITGGGEIPRVNPLNAWIHNGTLHVSGLTTGKLWRLFSISGAVIQQGIADSDVVEIPLKTTGVYIIQSEGNAIKVSYF